MGWRERFSWLRRWHSAPRRQGSGNPALDAAVAKASDIHGRIPLDRFMARSQQHALARELFLELHRIFSAAAPQTECRDRLVQEMLRFAPLQVVMLPPPPEADVTGLRALPGLSGELRAYLPTLVQRDLELRRRLEVEITADAAALQAALARCYWQSFWFLETFDAARLTLGDVAPRADWYLPFTHAVCVTQEHRYRTMLDLPPVFVERIAQAVVAAYSIYTDVVVSGAADPDREWREYCASLGIPELSANGECLASAASPP